MFYSAIFEYNHLCDEMHSIFKLLKLFASCSRIALNDQFKNAFHHGDTEAQENALIALVISV
jgi:hypothetical protein